MEVRNPLDDSLVRMAAFLKETKGTTIIIAVTDDTVLREHAVKALGQRLPAEIKLEEFRYDTAHISLLEGANGSAPVEYGRRVISAVGLDTLPRDKQSEAIKLLNRQRNQFGKTDLAVVLWLNRALLAEVSRNAADFYSWRSATFFIEPPADWNKLESARRSYLYALRSQNEYVNLQGLAPMRGGQIVQMRMDDIFVPIRARPPDPIIGWAKTNPFVMAATEQKHAKLPHLSSSRSNVDTDKWRLWLLAHDDLLWTGSKRQRLFFDPLNTEPPWEEMWRPMFAAPKRRQELRAVILGDPGAGKTTFLRYLAYCLATLESGNRSQIRRLGNERLKPGLGGSFPVYIRVGEYSQHLKLHPNADFQSFALVSSEARQLPLSSELLEEEIFRGRTVFLLDGLDEISDSTQRHEVAQRIQAFAIDHPMCSILVTSRIVGYRESRLGPHFPELTIRPFEDAEIERFAVRWYSALKVPEGADSLISAIKGNSAIHMLASNPLLLTVIALIHYRGTKLPYRRVELYERAAETLVDQWMNARRVVPEGWDPRLAMTVILPAVAWHLHAKTSSGLIEENELQGVLVKALKQAWSDPPEDVAQAQASRFRRDISEFSGIFLERGLSANEQRIYGFLHLTFEEYFAARRLTDKWQREGNAVLGPLLHDPRWSEVILLAAGHLAQYSQFEATKFVRAILEAGSQYEEILHRDLLLTARCLGDDARVDTDLRKLIESRLLAIYFERGTNTSLRADLRRAFGWFRNLQVGMEVSGLLSAFLASDDESVAELAARGISELGDTALNDNVTEQLLKLLDRGSFLSVEAAGKALAKRTQHKDLIEGLLERLSAENWQASYGAAYALGELGTAAATPDVISGLLCLLSSDDLTLTDDLTRWAAARALGRMGRLAARDEVIAQLRRHLRKYHATVSEAAAVSLGQIVLATGEKAEVNELIGESLKLIERGAADTKNAAALLLGQLTNGAATDEVIERLVGLLRRKYPTLRAAAALALTGIGQSAATDEVLTQLEKLTLDADSRVRRTATAALGELGKFAIRETTVTHVLRLLSDEEWYVRSTASIALGSLGRPNPQVIAGLLGLLADEVDEVASSAAEALGRLGERAATVEVMARLDKILMDKRANRMVQRSVISALANLAGYLPLDAAETTASMRHWLPIFWMIASGTDPEMSDPGYVGLRNLVSKAGTTLAESSEPGVR